MIKITPATSTEINDIAILQANALVDDQTPVKLEVMNVFINEMRRRCEKLVNEDSNILALKENTKVIGYAIYSCMPNNIEIKKIYVEKHLRRLGYGKSLFTAILEHAKQEQMKYLTTWVVEDHPVETKFYSTLGFLPSTIARMDQLSEEIELKEIFYQFSVA